MSNRYINENNENENIHFHVTDIEEYIDTHKSAATKKKTKQHTDLFLQYLLEQGENRALHSLPVETLDFHMSRFFVSVRKVDGSEYEPCSICAKQFEPV